MIRIVSPRDFRDISTLRSETEMSQGWALPETDRKVPGALYRATAIPHETVPLNGKENVGVVEMNARLSVAEGRTSVWARH